LSSSYLSVTLRRPYSLFPLVSVRFHFTSQIVPLSLSLSHLDRSTFSPHVHVVGAPLCTASSYLTFLWTDQNLFAPKSLLPSAPITGGRAPFFFPVTFFFLTKEVVPGADAASFSLEVQKSPSGCVFILIPPSKLLHSAPGA